MTCSVLFGKNVQFSQRTFYVEAYGRSTQDSLSISPAFFGVLVQRWGHLRVPFQAYTISNGREGVILKAGHASACIFEVWRGLVIWTDLVLYKVKIIQFSLISIILLLDRSGVKLSRDRET